MSILASIFWGKSWFVCVWGGSTFGNVCYHDNMDTQKKRETELLGCLSPNI